MAQVDTKWVDNSFEIVNVMKKKIYNSRKYEVKLWPTIMMTNLNKNFNVDITEIKIFHTIPKVPHIKWPQYQGHKALMQLFLVIIVPYF